MDNSLYLLGDHLGSTSLSVSESGDVLAEAKYTPVSPKGMLREGEQRTLAGDLPTDYGYTGQREESALGLMYYVARWYDSGIGHFVQADTVVPGAGNPAAWNRYAYVMYNPLRYVDPSGHGICDAEPGKPIPDFCISPQNPGDGVAPPVYSLNRGAGYGYSPDHLAYDYNDPPTDLHAMSEGSIIVNDPCHLENCENLERPHRWETNWGYGNLLLVEYPILSMPDFIKEDFLIPSINAAEKAISEGISVDDMSVFILYAHLDEESYLAIGSSVGPDQWIGTMGNTGQSTGTHLHMEVFVGPSEYFQPTNDLFEIKTQLNNEFIRMNPQLLEKYYYFDPYYYLD